MKLLPTNCIRRNILSERDKKMQTELFKKYRGNLSRFVESGTHHGAGIQAAIHAGFLECGISSFEPDKKKANLARLQFPMARIFATATPCAEFEFLAMHLPPSMFWLDAHKMGGGGRIPEDYPLSAEVEILAKSTAGHVILCDDVRLFERYGTSIEEIVDMMNGNMQYRHELETCNSQYPNDVLILTPEVK